MTKLQANNKKVTGRPVIEFSAVCYGYEGSTAALLSDFSVKIARGSMVLVTGESGAGKSTFLDLMLGLIEPTLGKVLVDGTELDRDNVVEWRHRVGFVPQSVFLTDETIWENIAFGCSRADVDWSAVNDAIDKASLGNFVRRLENGIETRIGENGAKLSGGERQRLGIARALYRDPDVLVLDEATSALDEQTERAILAELAELMGRVTVIAVTHRDYTSLPCDQHIVLRKSR